MVLTRDRFSLDNKTTNIYDRRGNLLIYKIYDDYENMVKKITFPDGTTNEFYNCTCGTKRAVKIDSTGYSSFFYEEHQGIEHILLEYDQSDVLKAEYTLGPGIDEIISRKTAQGTIYYHYNSLGSVTMLTDETGNLIGKYEYDPYGQILSQPEGTDNRFTFTGREYDKDSGLYFYRARYYDASVGRFMTRDPLLKTISTSAPDCATCGGAHPSGCGISSGLNIYNPSDLHPYVYVRNNPVNISDPYGEEEIVAGTLSIWVVCDRIYREFKVYQMDCESEKMSSGCPGGFYCKALKTWMDLNRHIVKRCGERGAEIKEPLWWQ